MIRRNIKKSTFLLSATVEQNHESLWDKYRKDFANGRKAYRGYGLSDLPRAKLDKYLTGKRGLEKGLHFVPALVFRVLEPILSSIFLGDTRASAKYGFKNYDVSYYDSDLVAEFQTRYASFGIGLSHNSLKSLSYLRQIEHLFPGKNLDVLEIGAGLFNFGHLLSLNVDEMRYVVVDLPEVGLAAQREIQRYRETAGATYVAFTSQQVEDFLSSPSKKKVLFLGPDYATYLDFLGLKFDFLVNHESFGEITIESVNSYLSKSKSLLKNGALFNSVNRKVRAVGGVATDVTRFQDYNLQGFETVVRERDGFRDRIPFQKAAPNIFYLARWNPSGKRTGAQPS